MDTVLRALAVYVFLLVLFRLSGKRTASEMTTFDLVLLLIVSEATQQALIGKDYSFLTCAVAICTLLSVDIGLSLVKRRFRKMERILEGEPLVLVENGRPLHHRLRMERVDEEDILQAARHLHGLERLDQIKFAVLERSGGISVIPK